jgi:hypothetical protein
MTHADCNCCSPRNDDAAGQRPVNPPGLSAIAYRIGTQGTFKRTMKARLGAQPALLPLTTRADDDPAIALLDAWACTLDVLTFYQERIANEGYLGTCTERRSVLELARAIGYELRPGVAASTDLAFTLETAPGAPLAATIATGTKVQSVPGQGKQAQIFETLEPIDALAVWNALRVTSTRSIFDLTIGRSTIYLQGANTRLQAGDALLIVGDERVADAKNENWDFRRVHAVRVVQPVPPAPDGSGSYTIVTLDRGLGRGNLGVRPAQKSPRVYALRTRANLFGYNAPDWRAMPPSLRATYLGLDSNTQSNEIAQYPEWPRFSLAELSGPPPVGALVEHGLRGYYFDGTNFGQPLFSSVVDAQVNFDSRPGSVAPWRSGVPAGYFSARWVGWLTPTATGGHDFQTLSDDGVRLWVDGRLLIDNWTLHGPTIDPPTGGTPASIDLTAQRRYEIRLEYFEGPPTATLQLKWKPPGAQDFSLVPTQRLEPRAIYDVKLDAVYPKFATASWLVLATPAYAELYSIEATGETACADFAVSAKTTWVRLAGENLLERFDLAVRETAVFGDPEELCWVDPPSGALVGGNSLTLTTLEPTLQAGQRIAITGLAPAKSATSAIVKRLDASEELALLRMADDGSGATLRFTKDLDASADLFLLLVPAAEVATLQGVDNSGATSVLRLTGKLVNRWLAQTVRINANVAPASHGDSRQMRIRPEVLGSGDGSAVFRSFDLKQTPLTYVAAANASGAETTLHVSVGGVEWKESPGFYGVAGNARRFTTRRADDGTVTVRFGDGATGARLPTGVENVTAVYRVGIGAAGNLDPGQLQLLLTPQLGVKSVANPIPATGGTDPEPLSRARRNAPLTVSTLDRIVSLVDFEQFAAAFTGIGKAKAVWLWNGQTRLVHLTVAAVDGSAIAPDSALLGYLRTAIDAARPPYQELRIGVGNVIKLPLEAQIAVSEGRSFDTVSKAVVAALRTGFGFDARAFGQPLSGSEVVATMQSVDGVDHVVLNALGSNGATLLSDPIEAQGAHWNDEQIVAAVLLLIDPDAIHLTEAGR